MIEINGVTILDKPIRANIISCWLSNDGMVNFAIQIEDNSDSRSSMYIQLQIPRGAEDVERELNRLLESQKTDQPTIIKAQV
jgi:hypothetical protein